MKRFVEGKGHSQSTLFPERLDNYVGEDNPVRMVMQFAIAINLAAVFPCFLKHICLPLVFNSTLAERSFQPRIKPTGVNTKHPAHDTHTELRAMHFDKGAYYFCLQLMKFLKK